MAYREDGSYYFDPNNDIEDQELYHDELKRQNVRNVVKQQQKTANEQQKLGTDWDETLKAEGLDQQTYQKLYDADPELVRGLMREGMKNLAKGMKRGRDPASGRFTKSETSPKVQQSQNRVAEIRAKAEKGGRVSEQDELDIIDALFPGGL